MSSRSPVAVVVHGMAAFAGVHRMGALCVATGNTARLVDADGKDDPHDSGQTTGMEPDASASMKPLHLAAALLIVCAVNVAGAAEPFKIPVTVIDGDTIKVNGETVRLWGIDAPEIDQTCHHEQTDFNCGALSRDVLVGLIQNDQPECDRQYVDCYGRTVARCAVRGLDLGSMMGSSGMGARL